MDFQPDSSDTGKIDGKDIYAAAGEKTFVVWNGIPTNTSGPATHHKCAST
jgi:hypothetical protein